MTTTERARSAAEGRPRGAAAWSAAVVLLQLTPLLLLAQRSAGYSSKPLVPLPRLDAALGEAGRQFVQAAPAPFVAYALSTVGLAPLLLCAGASFQFSRSFPPRAIARLFGVWIVLQLIALTTAAILLTTHGQALATSFGWAWRLCLWSSLASVPWLVLFTGISGLRASSSRRALAACCGTIALFVLDVGLSPAIPFPLFPGAVMRALLSARPGSGLLTVAVFGLLGVLLWRRSAPVEVGSPARSPE